MELHKHGYEYNYMHPVNRMHATEYIILNFIKENETEISDIVEMYKMW